jgi:hypothetical protein
MKLAPRSKRRGISILLRNLGLLVMRGIGAKARSIYPFSHNKPMQKVQQMVPSLLGYLQDRFENVHPYFLLGCKLDF